MLPVLLLLSELAVLYSNLNNQEQTGPTSGLHNLSCDATSAKCGLHAGYMKFITQNEE
jgi:hypothetical protein